MNYPGRKSIIIWLLTGAMLIAFMVVIGGITRLTHSGLSMVNWSLFMGAVPPISEQDWQETFNQYKQYPEYQKVNFNFSLNEFKSIFWWEYIHRMLGRLIGVVFIIPFLIFLIKKQIKKELIKPLIGIFILGILQGFMGWFMVKSGLINNPNVSHYRLASHLALAFTLYCFIIWLVFKLKWPNRNKISEKEKPLKKLILIGFFILILQIIYGAFVAGLKAGLMYPTWPMMDENWIPESVGIMLQKDGLVSLTNFPVSVQFIHRTIGIILLIIIGIAWIKSKKLKLTGNKNKAINLLLIILLIQFTLGVVTLLNLVPLSLGVLHQIGALALLTAMLNFIYQLGTNKQVQPK